MDKILWEAIDKAKVISFDIFDTLIVRVYKKPVDLFRHLEESEMAPGFAKARIEGEAKARRKALENSKREEVSLNEIYRVMGSKFAPFKEKEIALEKLACKQNPEMKAVFDECLSKGKRVVIASDMYLPHEVVEEILKKNGYEGYEKLFLSSDTMHPKATGKMYQDILTYAGVPAGDILHIGDHPYTDGEMAGKAEFENYLYLPIRETKGNIPNASYFATLNQYEEKSLVPSLLEGLITLHSARYPEESYWESFGYKYAGIMATGYMKWLKRELDQRGINKVFFMMRDGYIFKKVFDRLYPDFDTQEIYGSRTMFMLAGMESYEDVCMHVTGLPKKGLTYRRCYERLSVENKDLWQDYCASFEDLDAPLLKNEDFLAVDGFFKEHEEALKKIGMEERKLLLEYFESIGLFDGKCAVVDLGWKCSMLKGMEKICRMEERPHELLGFYFATHEFDNKEKVNFVCYVMEQGKTAGKMPYKALLNYGYTPAVMELMFTAPVPSTLKMQRKDNEIIPFYQVPCDEEKKRLKVSEKITKGVLAFLEDFSRIDEKFPVHISGGESIFPMEYISGHIHQRDAHEIGKLCTLPGTGNDLFSLPILTTGYPRFGLILTWPGDMSAEMEVLNRIEQAALDCGMECIPIDNYGHRLDSQGRKTDQFVSGKDLNFIISMHYESPKYLDAYYYFTIWNPPEIPLDVEHYGTISDRYLAFDDYLIYDDGGMKNHLKSILMNCQRDVDGASSLMASFPTSAAMNPNLKHPKLFYCGMNWDVLMGDGSGRNEGVMKLLDKEGVLKIFGPDANPAWGGIRPWEGYQCYQHPIPFDGFSILKELNDCGVCLVLSSDAHRRAGAVTNRAFEACAAGAVMISDDNPTMRKMFGDAALFIDFNRKNPEDTCKQILEKYRWILSHKKEATEIARRAQKLFIEKYSLDVYLKNIVHRHAERFDAVGRSLFAKEDKDIVLAAYVCGTNELEHGKKLAERVLGNVNHQLYKSILPVIAADASIAAALESYCEKICASVQVVRLPLYDKFGARRLTDGQALAKIRNCFPHRYFILASAGETWFYDHVTTLVRTLEDHPKAALAYAGQIFSDVNGIKFTHEYEIMTEQKLLEENPEAMPWLRKYPFGGVFMFRAECHASLPDYLFDCTDGNEYLLYLHMLCLREKKEAAFSKRLTLGFNDHYMDERHQVLSVRQEKAFIWGLTRYDVQPVPAPPPPPPPAPAIVQRNPYGLEEDTYTRFAFPYKMVAPGSRIVIYGGGIVGKAFLWQVANSAYCNVTAICDRNPAGTGILAAPVISLEELAGLDESKYDAIVIALERKGLAVEVKSDLEMSGISASKIKWLNPRRDGVVLQ